MLRFLCIVVTLAVVTHGYRRVCYHTNWSQYRQSPGKFFPENIDSRLCTHVIYAFATLNGNHIKAFEWNDESTAWSKGMYERFNAMKKTNPSVKTMLAVGGFNMGSGPFTRIVANDQNRQAFADDAVNFLRSHNFDGLDIDWEYPAKRGSPPQDKQNFVLLVKTIADKFDADAHSSGKPRLILSAAVSAGKDKIEDGYDIPQLSKYMDMINLMTYDLHGTWETYTGHNSPLKAGAMDTGDKQYLNVEWASREWVRRGAPKSMLNIGMPLYGHAFTLKDPSNNGVYAPTRGAGTAGRFTREKGFLAYYEICKMLPTAQKHMIQGEEVPYIVQGDQWVGYDDPESLRKKVDFVKQEQFGGIMVWDLALDDFTGSCGEGKYPLMSAIIDELSRPGSGVVIHNPVTQPPIQTPQPHVTPDHNTHAPWTPIPHTQAPWTPAPHTQAPWTPAPHTQAPWTQAPHTQAPHINPPVITTAPPAHHTVAMTNHFNCATHTTGFYANPTDCNKYFICAAGAAFEVACTPGLHFNPSTLYCDWPVHAKCQVQMTQAPHTNAPHTDAPTMAPHTNAPTMAPHTNAPITNAPIQTFNPTNAPHPTPSQTIAPATNHNMLCLGKTDGYFLDPDDCGFFFQCSFGLAFREPCPPGLVFNEGNRACDYPFNVQVCSNYRGRK